MKIPGDRNSRMQTGNSGWISIHVNGPEPAFDLPSVSGESGMEQTEMVPPALIHLFEHVEGTPAPLPERFPRLTFLAVALALLVTALTAEFDYLRGAGYFWP